MTPYIWVWHCPICHTEARDDPPEYYKLPGKTVCHGCVEKGVSHAHKPAQMKHKKKHL